MLRGLWAFFLSALFLFAVDAGGGGGGDDDFLIDDPTPPEIEPPKSETPKEEKNEKTPPKATLDDETQAEIDELKDFKNGIAVEKAVVAAADAIKGEYPDFDIEKVSTFLQELHKTDPEKAEKYNSPTGWETVWLKNFAKSSESEGEFDPGRNNADEPFDFDKTQKTALSGDKRAMKKLFENSK